MIIQFERKAKGCAVFHGKMDQEEAIIQATIKVANMEDIDSFEADNFNTDNDAAFSKKMNGKCYGSPFVLDERSVRFTGGTSENERGFLFFEATQHCVYFTTTNDEGTAVALACVMAFHDDVIPIECNVSDPHCWSIQVPEGMPLDVLASCMGRQHTVYVASLGKAILPRASGM